MGLSRRLATQRERCRRDGWGPVRNGRYEGVVGPGWPISFHVSADGTKVEQLVAAFDAGCNGGAPTVAPKFHFSSLEIRDGRFSGRTSDSFGTKVSIGVGWERQSLLWPCA